MIVYIYNNDGYFAGEHVCQIGLEGETLLLVEPENADCVFQSIKNNKPTSVDIKKETVMGGMSCGDVSSIAWEILKNSSNYCLTIYSFVLSFLQTVSNWLGLLHIQIFLCWHYQN